MDDDDRDDALFREYAKDVKPLAGRDKYVSPAAPTRGHTHGSPSAARPTHPTPSRPRFEICDEHEVVTGRHRDSLSKTVLAQLRNGEFPIEARIDLHGYFADRARDRINRDVAKARASGERCLLLIHGRGHHSPGGESVLRRIAIEEISQGPQAKHVLGFATAQPRHGGKGAMYVLLRKARPDKPPR